MVKQSPNVDPLNDPIRIARDMGFQQIVALWRQLPNPLGETDNLKVPALSQAELKRLIGGG